MMNKKIEVEGTIEVNLKVKSDSKKDIQIIKIDGIERPLVVTQNQY